MVAMTDYTVTVERGAGDRVWVFQCVEVPGAISESKRLSEVFPLMREAIAFVADVPQESVDITLDISLAPGIHELIESIGAKRTEAERLAQEASRAAVEAAHRLVEESHLPLRDAGFILGVSHQRVAQLLDA